MSAYVSQSGEQEAVGGERASGGRSVARLAGLDRLSPSLPQWHFVTLTLSTSSLFLSLSDRVGIHHFYIYSAVLRTLYKMTMTSSFFVCQFFCTFGMAFVFIRHQQHRFCFVPITKKIV